jgi:hypothetical protein
MGARVKENGAKSGNGLHCRLEQGWAGPPAIATPSKFRESRCITFAIRNGGAGIWKGPVSGISRLAEF